MYTQTGTPYYASPEIWRDEAYNSKSDIWSLGCVIYELCAHKPPFISNEMKDLYQKIQRGYFSRIPGVYSNELQDFIEKCLQKSSAKRPNVESLIKIIGRRMGEEEKIENKGVLLKTIKIPKNLKCLGDVLPRANYENREGRERELSFPKIREKGGVGKKGENKENVSVVGNKNKAVNSVKHVKMPKIEARSRSPNIFKG